MNFYSFDQIIFFLRNDLFNLINQDQSLIYLVCSFFVFLLFLMVFKTIKKNKLRGKAEAINKPVVNDVISRSDTVINADSDKNDFIDVLTAIEEEMAAVRELYVNGYITKGIYISETDRLYEKAKIFGL